MTKVLLTALISIGLFTGYSFSVNNTQNEDPASDPDAGNVNWMTFEEAIAKIETAKKAGIKPKKIFIDVYTDWCGWCKKMDAATFQQKEISAYLNQHFYPVKFNAEQKEDINFAGRTFKFVPSGRRGYHQLAAALLDGKMSYPTVIFMNEEIQLLQRIPGYLDVPTFDTILHYLAEEHYKTTPWADYQKQYQSQKLDAKN